jgi:hypothetical protein
MSASSRLISAAAGSATGAAFASKTGCPIRAIFIIAMAV